MGQGRNRWLLVRSFIVSLVLGVVLGTVVQTHFNLQALIKLGVSLPTSVQSSTYASDLLHFGPIYAVVFGVSFLLSQLVALFLVQFAGSAWRLPLCTVAAPAGLYTAFVILDHVLPMPTLIAATRSQEGVIAMLTAATLAGLSFGLQLQRIKPQAIAATAIAALALGSGMSPQPAQAAKALPYQTKVLADGLQNPWSLAFLPDGRMLITERSGQLRVFKDGKLGAPLAGVPSVFAQGQGGLLEVLPALDFAKSQAIYLSYACGTRQANHTCVSRYTLTDTGLQQGQEVFRTQPAKAGGVHFGGRMVWLPDQTLVLTLGDGFNYREQAQTLDNHFGKLVRITADGKVPADNPFVKTPGALPTIYSRGHRNVQGLYYDASTKQLLAHEHGPRGGDELNVIQAGANYGWPIATYGLDYTGATISPFTEQPGTEQPAQYWVPSIAVSGMTVVQGNTFPQWNGSVLVGALAAQQVQRVVFKGNKSSTAEVLFKELGERIRDVRQGPDGMIYLLTDSPKGKLIQVSPQ